jgi:hypothetical protein
VEVATVPEAFVVRQFDPTLPNPVIARLPGRVTVSPDRPIVIPVAVEVPIEIVLEASSTTLPSLEILVPVNVRSAKELLTMRSNKNAATVPPPMNIFLMFMFKYFVILVYLLL